MELCSNIDKNGRLLFGKNFMESVHTMHYKKDDGWHTMYMGLNSKKGFKLVTDGIDLSERLTQGPSWFSFGKIGWDRQSLRRLDDNHFILAVFRNNKTYYNAFDFRTLKGLIDSKDVTEWFDGYSTFKEHIPFFQNGSEWVSFSYKGKWNYFHVPSYSFIDIPRDKWFDIVGNDPTFEQGYEFVGVKIKDEDTNKESFRYNYISPDGKLLYKEKDKKKWFASASTKFIKDYTYVRFEGRRKDCLLTPDGKVHELDKNGDPID